MSEQFAVYSPELDKVSRLPNEFDYSFQNSNQDQLKETIYSNNKVPRWLVTNYIMCDISILINDLQLNQRVYPYFISLAVTALNTAALLLVTNKQSTENLKTFNPEV